MKLNYFLFLVSLALSGKVYAERLVISDIMSPENLENIHVVKLASDSFSTDFVIFVKNKVPLHKHVKHSETIYVLEGKAQLQLGEQSMEITVGDYIRVPQGMPHGVKVLSSVPLKILSVQAPEFFGKDRVKMN
ncbi:cupin domain-containing protein [Gammaproteobacteria bacterium]|jgi:mannose-6-phosphate isomerase-like protein (cupin superfamily)|nr:cupin domain-containing protein [Gammaproteobacteria bacterium]MDB9800115.1 cupin domain-containing protein [bacterium]|tara:strand:- start:3432 stop:3830 length:399 start_codon:yes stop_codon:yes gene_type:complete